MSLIDPFRQLHDSAPVDVPLVRAGPGKKAELERPVPEEPREPEGEDVADRRPLRHPGAARRLKGGRLREASISMAAS